MSGRATTLNELMGKAGSGGSARKLNFDDLKDLIGEGLPEIDFDRVGRVRLINALKQRFGVGFRNLPGVKDIIKDFDDRSDFEQELARMKGIKVKKNG